MPDLQSIGPDVLLSVENVEAVARDAESQVQRTDAATEALKRARVALEEVEGSGAAIYGVTTGFGALVNHRSNDSSQGQAQGLLHHLSTGSGPAAPSAVVRAMIVARLQSLAQGHSGLRVPVFDALADLLNASILPHVPEIGSLGASGDLTPLAHVARVLTGEGTVHTDDGSVPAAQALCDAGLDPVTLDGRDALALVNGTAFMTGLASLGTARAARLLRRAEALTGWAYRLLGCSLEPLDAHLHDARGHDGQTESAAAIRDEATRDEATRDGYREAENRPFQEVYSLRCAPQVLGAVRDQLRYVRSTVETELNGTNDNPVIDPDGPRVLHGGNFQGQHIAFAADALNAALTQIGVLAERQIDLLLTPDQNGGAPPLLAWTPGPTSGLAGAQLTATALVAELRHDAQMSATFSIPTNGDNQDIVSMGAMAARRAYQQTEHLAPILGVLSMALAQLTHLRRDGRADGPAPDPPAWMPAFEPVVEDRPLESEIDDLAGRWLQR
jgi:histidine ammonia-lyase/tyrosine ammonia-lyase